MSEKEIQELWCKDPEEYYRFKQQFLDKHDMADYIMDVEGNLVGATYNFDPYHVWQQEQALKETGNE